MINHPPNSGKKRDLHTRSLRFASEAPVVRAYTQSKVVAKEANQPSIARSAASRRGPISGKRFIIPDKPFDVSSAEAAGLVTRFAVTTDFST